VPGHFFQQILRIAMMLRASVLVFIAGWVSWFLVDKAGLMLPRTTESLLQNFQTAFDMLRAGYPLPAYVFIWQSHYVVLSLLGGLLLTMLYGAVRDALARRRLRKVMRPLRNKETPGGQRPPASQDNGNDRSLSE
jgi:hypothetical protein